MSLQRKENRKRTRENLGEKVSATRPTAEEGEGNAYDSL